MKTENRKEYKLILSQNELNEFFNKYSNNLENLHSPRIIKSLYFDTLNFALFHSLQYHPTKFLC